MFRQLLVLFLSMHTSFVLAEHTVYLEILQSRLNPDKNNHQHKFLGKTKDALLSYDRVEERADYLICKVKNLTFGQYTEDILLIAPLITGNIDIRAYDFNVYYKHNDNKKAGIEYTYNF